MKRPLCVLAGLLAATLLAGAASAADLISLRLGDVKGDRYAALRASGELDDLPYKLEMSAFPSGAPVLEALNAGALDIGFTGDIPFLFVYAAGAPLKAVGAWHFNPATVALVVGKDSPIRSVAGLKGKRIAVNRGGWGHFLALGALRRAGLGPQDVSFSFLGPVDGRAALVRGSVDAWVPWEPYTSSAVLLDQARVIDNGAGIMTGYSYALASDAAIARKKAAISDLLTRLARAQAWALRHPEAFAEALAKDLNMPREVTRRWVGEARISPVVFGPEVAATLQTAADFFHAEGVLPKSLEVAPAFDFSLSAGAAEVARRPPRRPALRSYGMRQTLSLFLLLCLLVGQACADERVTLRLADQKGNMRAQLEAAGALDNLTYDIRWFEFPAAAPLAEALNAGAVDAGIIGDAPLLFALAAGARLKAIAVDKSDPYGTAVLVRGDSPLRSANDLKGQRIATGRGSIGHFVALKALASVGLGEKDVEFRFLGPVDAKMALANGSVDAWATWEPYTAFAETADKARVLVDGRGLWAGNSFLAATDSALADPAKRAVLQDYLQRLASAQRWAYLHLDEYSRSLAQIIGFPEDAARLQFERRRLRWQALDERTLGQQQETADFYQAHGLIPQRLDVRPTFASGFAVRQASDADIR